MGTLRCRLVLDKKAGATVTVEDAQGKVTQTICLDGTRITTKVAGSEATSEIIQTADTLEIRVKHLVIDAETVSVASKKETRHRSDDSFTVTSGKAMELRSQDTLSIASTKDLSVEAETAAVRVEAKTAATLVGASVTAQARSGKAELLGPQVRAGGGTQATVEAGTVELTAQGRLAVRSSGLLQLKGALTKVEGQMKQAN